VVEQILTGIILGGLISYLAYRAGALSRGGMLAAWPLGAVVFGLGGFAWAIILLGFFVTSSLLSRLAKKKTSELEDKFSKSSRRDAAQVMANGGLAGGLVTAGFMLSLSAPDSSWLTAIWLAYCGSLAAANADTWGTELGVLNRAPPILITTGQPVEHGTSGAISLSGTLAALGGSVFIALLAAFLDWTSLMPSGVLPWWAYLLATVGGTAGALIDSLLGATLQAIYICPTCKKETEQYPFHTCGAATQRVRGLPWLNNDLVNLTCILVGAMIPLTSVFFL
jgi:uncharacterized protein (TIGR00297 family)